MVLFSSISRFWRRRGYGVHSPFVYKLLRSMLKGGGEQSERYRELLSQGVERSVARDLARIAEHSAGHDMILCHNMEQSEVEKRVAYAAERGITIAIVEGERGRYDCDTHNSTSIQGRGYTVLFNNGLPKQNFNI